MELIGPLIIFVSFPAIIAWAIWYTKRRKKKLLAGLKIISNELGLKLIPAKKGFWKPKLEHLVGNYKGVFMAIAPREERQGRSSEFFTDFIVNCHNPRQMKLLIEPEGILNAIGDLLGVGDTKIGDSQFDERFRIRAEKTNHLVALLDPETKARIYSLWDTNDWRSKIRIEGNEIIYTEHGLPGVNGLENRAENIANALVALSKKMEMLDWEDNSGSSFWDENTNGNEAVMQ